MNAIFLSQGSALTLFHRLVPSLKKQLKLSQIGFFVADQPYFEKTAAAHDDLLNSNYHFLKEWELVGQSKTTKINPKLLSALDNKYGDPTLWAALVADRRVYLGKNTKYTQDYQPRLSHQAMLQLLQHTTQSIERFIDTVKPDFILGFNMVTMSEFLFYLIAKQQQIPYYQIKHTKIANYVTLIKDPLNLSQNVQPQTNQTIDPIVRQRARDYLTQAQTKQSSYEGHVIQKAPSIRTILTVQLLRKLTQGLVQDIQRNQKYPFDRHSGGFPGVWHGNVGRTIKAIRQHQYLKPHYLNPDKLASTKYVLFPLHTEPEIALSIYGRYYQNQIELIRNIAQSIPVTWSVVVKDHPRSLGLRSMQYYRKLLAIPNVRLVNPYISSYDIVEHCQAATVITSWVGFEAAIFKKPVVTFGQCTFNALPNYMVTKNTAPANIANDIKQAINDYRYDEETLLQHIMALISNAYPINLYTDVLKKPNRHKTDDDQDDSINGLANYIASTISSDATTLNEQVVTNENIPAYPS